MKKHKVSLLGSVHLFAIPEGLSPSAAPNAKNISNLEPNSNVYHAEPFHLLCRDLIVSDMTFKWSTAPGIDALVCCTAMANVPYENSLFIYARRPTSG
jgi:hypothetical protein